MMTADAPELRHRLRVLISVDMVGSTAFKQGREQEAGKPSAASSDSGGFTGPPWLPEMWLFYTEMGRCFADQWQAIESSAPPVLLGPEPCYWKTLGDELLYYKELRDYRQTLSCLYAWRQTVKCSRKTLAKRNRHLDLKATAWIANFPIPNCEIAFERDWPSAEKPVSVHQAISTKDVSDKSKSTSSSILDFVGPSIDTGFRLSALASPRKLVVSIGLAWMVAEAMQDPDCSAFRDLVFYYDGAKEFKGVLGGKPYPVFWVDMMPDSTSLNVEDSMLGRRKVGPDEIIKFCNARIKEDPEHFFPPYIDPAQWPDNPKFREVYSAHAKKLEQLKLI